MCKKTLFRAFSEMQTECDGSSDDMLQQTAEKYVEIILEALDGEGLCIEDTDGYLEPSASIYERSEGEIFHIGDILERGAYFVEEVNAHDVLVGCMGMAASGLYLSVDPEEYGFVLDGLCSIALTAADMDENLKPIATALTGLRNDFNGICHSLNDDEFLEVVEHLESDEDGDVPATLRDFFISVSEGRDDSALLKKLFLERYFGI